jgi:hypothetical protein
MQLAMGIIGDKSKFQRRCAQDCGTEAPMRQHPVLSLALPDRPARYKIDRRLGTPNICIIYAFYQLYNAIFCSICTYLLPFFAMRTKGQYAMHKKSLMR